MKQPINTKTTPPRGWTIDFEGLGPLVSSNHFNDFMRQVYARLEANGTLTHDWREETLDLLCRQRPDIPCEDRELPERAVTSEDVKRWFKSMWETWKSGAQAVSAEEQDRRASICRDCPKRGHVSCFGGCGAMAEALSQMIVGTKARSYPDLHKTSCLVCSCEITSLVLFPLEVIQKVDEEAGFKVGDYPEHCWKLKTSPRETEPQAHPSEQPPS